jgi:hypothetical protein
LWPRKPFIRENLEVRPAAVHGRPTELMEHYAAQIRDYIACHRNRFVTIQGRIRHHWLGMDASDSEPEAEAGRGHQLLTKKADRFFQFWNGPLWDGGRCVHYQPLGCTRSREDIVQEMAESAKDYLFSAIPAVPAVNKWTKLAPCCDWVCMALLVHNLLNHLFCRLKAPNETLQEGIDLEADIDEELRKDVAFAAVVGKRYSKSRAFLGEAGTLLVSVCLCLVLEPLRSLSSFWMRAASEVEDPCRPPRLQDVVNPRYSVIVHSCQYLATLVAGRAPRLILLWRSAGSPAMHAIRTRSTIESERGNSN